MNCQLMSRQISIAVPNQMNSKELTLVGTRFATHMPVNRRGRPNMSAKRLRLWTHVRSKCVFLRADEGQALVTVALALTVLLGFTGLAVDMGVLRYEKRLQQTAADAAAIAGASNLPFGGVVSG